MRTHSMILAAALVSACSMKASTFTPLDDDDDDGSDVDAGDDDVDDCDAGCAGVSIPRLRLPMNDAYVGRVFATNSLRPTFVWEASTATSGAIEYEIQYSTDAGFASGVTSVRTGETSHRPATELAVSFTPPVGARYYWRVRACVGEACSAFSPAWWVNVGRSDRDFNGDGFADLLVGAPDADAHGESTGSAYLVLGRASGSLSTSDVADGEAAGDLFGGRLGFADVNADGFCDVLVGATFAASDRRGAASVFLGSAGGQFGSPFAIAAPEGADDFGVIASAGDVNADGFADVIVGGQLSDIDRDVMHAGRAFIYSGGPGDAFDTTPDAALDAQADGDSFGLSVATAGDVNGDGIADVVVGAPQNDAGGEGAGRAYVYLGGTGTFDTSPDGVLTGEAPGDWFGVAVAAAGDVNGDGFGDVIVGAVGNQTGGPSAGSASVYLGAAGMTFDEDPVATIRGAAGDDLGFAVASAGDVNADGFSDVVVGAHESDVGHVEIYLGGPGDTFDTVIDGRPAGDDAGELFGIATASAGDVNGDGFSDVVVGASPFGGPSKGAAYVFRGGAGASFDEAYDDNLIGSADGDRFGIFVW